MSQRVIATILSIHDGSSAETVTVSVVWTPGIGSSSAYLEINATGSESEMRQALREAVAGEAAMLLEQDVAAADVRLL